MPHIHNDACTRHSKKPMPPLLSLTVANHTCMKPALHETSINWPSQALTQQTELTLPRGHETVADKIVSLSRTKCVRVYGRPSPDSVSGGAVPSSAAAHFDRFATSRESETISKSHGGGPRILPQLRSRHTALCATCCLNTTHFFHIAAC